MKTYNSDYGRMTVPESPVTRNIAGHDIKLEAGIRYRASRPMAEKGRTIFPVTIWEVNNAPVDPDVIIDGLTYKEANELVNAFNNGVSSFEGRVW